MLPYPPVARRRLIYPSAISGTMLRISAMPETSPNAAILDALLELELRQDRIFEMLVHLSDRMNDVHKLMQIFADREF